MAPLAAATPKPDIRLRPARPGEAQALSALCLRSKAYWGYDAAFMAAVEPYLKVTDEAIRAGHVTVAQSADGNPVGVCQIDPNGHGGSLDLLFIEPDIIGTGAGRALFERAKAQLKSLGLPVMTILSDPYAEPAYLHMGARRVEMRSSDVFPGRELPWLEVAL
ncbi:GNAT family N-acetyltransferase [Maricaulis salignorans]|uniref:Acetyltransferase (GNAT) domain-containing protein n=1 Tax=Maricaulis salignorans TaxID=144026 RepID=A0A1G9N683_9PROT|nr:GNAT family N-acetyltransferase [Maricaulis salignorans]SDL81893.1 Acetyltransferase (GNAT) domain-containing protein [Maricaulis salignorans]